MKPLLLLLTLAVVHPASARLGETEAELIQRFGKPTLRNKHSIMGDGRMVELGPQLHFQQEEWTIAAVLIDGRVARESYGKRGKWTDEQIKAVLTANSQGDKWTETSKNSSGISRAWRRADGATARWTFSGMELTHPAYARAEKIAEAKAKAASGRVPKL